MLRHQLLCIRIIAVFFVYLLSFATLSAQEVRIVLSGTELPARDLFIQIERQTVYRFAYNSAVFDASQVQVGFLEDHPSLRNFVQQD